MGDAGGRQVFINCPFSDDYRPMFEAIVFAVVDCGFVPRCALEADDAGEVRFEKIIRIIRACDFGVHDISMMDRDPHTGLAWLNMSFELGLFLGARRFGGARQKTKVSLILDSDRFRYQRAISDIAGQDIRAHGGDPARAIAHVRDWLQVAANEADIPGGGAIATRYRRFQADLPAFCEAISLDPETLTFIDLSKAIARWLKGRT
ncbi:MAG: hypothetical protein FD124_1962 [Alphaproteobacteria bacterium]|nr:MAG: hypothetical protein FD160_652 [Caulobacteraceae bacterium]TPW05848.1 MAG: hypothetical protein FD124_1962 [Alphaproteobacteria bacterium]